MQTSHEIAIVHLIRAGNEAIVTAQFIDSYLKHPAGCHHTLVFLLKGFARDLPRDLSAILERAPHVRMVCPDEGFDIGSYFYAAERLTERVVVFLNSFSTIQSDYWLSKLAQAHCEPGVGLVGASGSWESLVTTLFLECKSESPVSRSAFFSRFRAHTLGLLLWAFFPKFPNPHVRSNAFMLTREVFLSIRPRRTRFKFQTWLFESGRVSMTRRIRRGGLRVMVVGRDGIAYRIEDWPKSRTFWQYQQENLLIHDNRSLTYSRAGKTTRTRLSRAAWSCADETTNDAP